MMLVCSALLALAAATAPPPASPAPAAIAPTQDLASELEALEREFDAALDALDKAIEAAKTDEERAKLQRDPAKDPRKLFLPKFQAFAERAKGAEPGARALMWILSNVRERDSDVARAAVDGLVQDHRDSPVLAELATTLRYNSWMVGAEHAVAALQRVAKDAPEAQVRATALLALGAIQADQGGDGKKEAATVFHRVLDEYPDSTAADGARGFLYELEHLQIGMIAPDFEAIDENEVRYKLSDYRGKVVVLDFWGFW